MKPTEFRYFDLLEEEEIPTYKIFGIEAFQKEFKLLASRPKVMLLEGKKGLLTDTKGTTLKELLSFFEDKNYYAYYQLMSPKEYVDIPMDKESVFIVVLDKMSIKQQKAFQFPERMPISRTINDFLEKGKQWDCYYVELSSAFSIELMREMKSKDILYQIKSSKVCALLPNDSVPLQMSAIKNTFVRDDFGIRRLTPREIFNFQGYSKKYVLPKISDTQLYTQAVKSPNLPLIKRLKEAIDRVFL
jgi:hypothetical protein